MGTTARIFLLSVLLAVLAGFAIGAEEPQNGVKEKEEAPLKKVEPIFPDENKYLIFFEGEDAVSTNFNKEATQNYSCSGSRSLQLSRTTSLQAGASFYADYVFYVEEDGTYELWYGGTPPGPKGDLYPSLSSPFKYSIDDIAEPKSVFREDVTVVENYAPSFYWNLVKEENLTRGRHQLRISVNEKRGYDGRFYFYVDCLFFVKKEGGSRILGSKQPPIFPKNLDDRRINQPFKPIDDYLIFIRDNPEEVAPLVEISLIYSLVSDYLNAVKYLKRALILAPDDINIKLLLAKNYIWMGEISTGLDMYKEILKKDSSKIGVWMEAGKVSGWTGRYKESIQFFNDGLQTFPDNLDLLVNLGLSFLWSGDQVKADNAIQRAKNKAGKDTDEIKALARVFMVNGYPEKAVEIYNQGIETAPADLQLYLLLEDTYLNSGKKKEADDVKDTISKRFISSAKLSRYLDLYHEKIGLKDKVLEGYRVQLESQPDNLELREMLAQTYFWNGLKNEAIREYLNILTNHAFRELKTMEGGASPLLEEIDRLSLLASYFAKIEKTVSDKKSEIAAQSEKYKSALSEYERSKKETVKGDPEGKFRQEATALAALLSDTEEIANRYAEIGGIYKAELETVAAVIDKAKKDEESFQKVMRAIQWTWDKRETLSELAEVSKNGLVLADHLLGRIALFDNNVSDSRARLEKIVTTNPYPEAAFALWEALLWSGDAGGADQLLSTYKSEMEGYMKYTGRIARLSSLVTSKAAGSGGSAEEGLFEKAKTESDRVSALIKDAQPNLRNINASIATLRERLVNKLVYTMYTWQENTYLLRNELGDFYLRNNAHDKAITQYKQVLAIDPYNVSAIYRIGTVYQWKQDWYEAMSSFNKVYQADPRYENAGSLYNSLARAHADEVHIDGDSYTDTSRFWMWARANYWKYLNSMFKFGILYRYDYERFFRTWLAVPNPRVSSFMVHSLGAGMQFEIPGLKIAPSAGLDFSLKDDFYEWEMNQVDPVNFPSPENDFPDLTDLANYGFLNALALAPWIEIQYSFNIGDLVSSWGYFGYQRYLDSYALHIDDVYELWTDASVQLKFPFLVAYPYKEGYVKLCPETHILSDKNVIIKPNLELYMPFFSIDNPNIVLSFTGTGVFENTFNLEGGDPVATNYYKPNEAKQALAQIGASFKFGPRDKQDIPVVSIKAGGGYYGYINWLGDQIDDTKFIGEAKFTLDGDKGNLSILANVNLTFMKDMKHLDFWSAEVKVEYTAKIQNLLAP